MRGRLAIDLRYIEAPLGEPFQYLVGRDARIEPGRPLIARERDDLAMVVGRDVGTGIHGQEAEGFANMSEALAAPDDLSSARALADVACLSPSRLREIVSRDFGVPPAKLLQWLQLQRSMRALVGGGGLADAAVAGGFADQSHFTRRCAQWLGVTPSAGLSAFAFEIVP